ncbi:unnamed protein product [Durusdinium trenchii]|uniref:Uncharacterized protein n=1 Tax=Durusdinium trenchii TaxID=1381693 RepID=A0ABP0HUR7_9DINO
MKWAALLAVLPLQAAGASLQSAEDQRLREITRFGPGACVSAFVSAAPSATCVVQTDCAQQPSFATYALRLICVDQDGGQVLHSFQEGGFDAEETFDTGIPCQRCESGDGVPKSMLAAKSSVSQQASASQSTSVNSSRMESLEREVHALATSMAHIEKVVADLKAQSNHSEEKAVRDTQLHTSAGTPMVVVEKAVNQRTGTSFALRKGQHAETVDTAEKVVTQVQARSNQSEAALRKSQLNASVDTAVEKAVADLQAASNHTEAKAVPNTQPRASVDAAVALAVADLTRSNASEAKALRGSIQPMPKLVQLHVPDSRSLPTPAPRTAVGLLRVKARKGAASSGALSGAAVQEIAASVVRAQHEAEEAANQAELDASNASSAQGGQLEQLTDVAEEDLAGLLNVTESASV